MTSVLVLEDDDGLRFTFQKALENQGYEVFPVATCHEAISVLEVSKPDVLILDLLIGVENSMNVASLATYKAPEAEIVYITGTSLFPGGELFNLSQNIRWVLRKPVPVHDLTSMVDHAVARNVQPSLC